MSSSDDHEPTPEEIADACREIQAAWSDSERRRRAGEGSPKWYVPEVKVVLDAGELRTSSDGS